MQGGFSMKYALLFGSLLLSACKPDANNDNVPPNYNASKPSENDKDPQTPTQPTQPDVTPEVPSDPNKKPDENPALAACLNDSPASSDHRLVLNEVKGRYELSFQKPSDAELRVISLYVTAKDDEVPTFENKFSFSGTAYWMVSLDDPFETFFTLPVLYGDLPPLGIDVTARYKGKAGGKLLSELSQASCLKFTVITFEPEEAQSFKTSTFLKIHRP